MRERVRFNQDVAKLERNDSHYKEKYDAILAVLRRYESERNLPAHAQTDAQAMQQQKLRVEAEVLPVLQMGFCAV